MKATLLKLRLGFVLIFFLLNSCQQKRQEQTAAGSAKKELLEADRAFSDLSREKGMKHAFVEYIDSNGVLLRAHRLPIVGANAIDFLIQQNDTGYTLTWQPQFAEAAASGDLGYTYGLYQIRLKSNDSLLFGTYTSIWKKQKDGKWKFVLDTGNEGLEPE